MHAVEAWIAEQPVPGSRLLQGVVVS